MWPFVLIGMTLFLLFVSDFGMTLSEFWEFIRDDIIDSKAGDRDRAKRNRNSF